VAAGPNDAARCDFRMDFFVELEVPFHAIGIDDFDLRIRAGHIFFIELKGRLRHLLFTADAPKKIEARYLSSVFPESGSAGLRWSVRVFIGFFPFLRFFVFMLLRPDVACSTYSRGNRPGGQGEWERHRKC